MLTNDNLNARKPGADAPEKAHYGFRTVEQFVYFMRSTGLNVTDVAKLFDMNYQKLRSVLYGVPGTRTLVQADLARIHRTQEGRDFPYPKHKINLFYILTGDRETPKERVWRSMAESRGKHLQEAQDQLKALETVRDMLKKRAG